MPDPIVRQSNELDESRLREAAFWEKIAVLFESVIGERKLRGQQQSTRKLLPFIEQSIQNASALRTFVAKGGR